MTLCYNTDDGFNWIRINNDIDVEEEITTRHFSVKYLKKFFFII